MRRQTITRHSALALLLVASFALLARDVTSQVHAQSAAPPQALSASRAETSQDAQAAQVINDSVLRVGELSFPKLRRPANAKGAAAQGCCTPGETKTVNVADIDLSTPNGYSKNKFIPANGPEERVHSVPPCWVIVSYARVIEEANPFYQAGVDDQAANFNYLTSTQYQAVYESLKDYVFKLNILDKYKAELLVKLQEFVKNYGSYSNSISTSHAQVRHSARVQGRGMFNGSSRYRAYVRVTEKCCPPEVRDAGQLKTTLKTWIDETASKLPKVGNPGVLHEVPRNNN
jgi:hypothetical protein